MKLLSALAAGTLLLAANPAFGAANLVVNGGFEQDLAPWYGSGLIQTAMFAIEGNFSLAVPYDARFVTARQDLTTVAGQAYRISFLANRHGFEFQQLVRFGDQQFVLPPSRYDAPQRFSFDAVATSTATILGFDLGPVGQRPFELVPAFVLDAVEVVAIGQAPGAPEPANWALMIAGFGLAGAALRRRPVRVASA